MTDASERYRKIKAIADDERGDPNTREIARRKLETIIDPGAVAASIKRALDEDRTYRPQPQAPGMERTPDHLQRMFLDLNGWKKNDKGNFVHLTSWKGVGYRVTLFRGSQDIPQWKWVRATTANNGYNGSGKFADRWMATKEEAHRDAWRSLQTL